MAAMPRVGDPRVVVRMSPEGFAVVKAAADRAGVSVGGLVRECAERYAASVAVEVRVGKVRLRRSSVGAREVSVAVREPEPAPKADPALWALERQRRLNEAKERS